MYELLLERQAQRDLDRFEPHLFKRLIRALKGLTANPRPPGSRKLRGSEADWRLRVGDYRIVYEIDEPAKAVRVMYVRHRRDAYR